MNRRNLLKIGLAAGTTLLLPAQFAWAAKNGTPPKRLIVVMLRGAIDGLSVVVPYVEENYYRLRSTIAIAKPGDADGALDLDGRFGLHPALEMLMPFWQQKQLAFIQASGSSDPTRSHFEAQDYMETGQPGVKRVSDGWMNRLLGFMPDENSVLNAVSLGPVLPRILSGVQDVSSVPLGREASRATAMDKPEINAAFDRMYEDSDALAAAYRQGRKSRKQVLNDLNSDPVSPESNVADNGAPSPAGFALDASQLATLVRRNPGMQLAFAQLGGWDTHVSQGGARGQLANRLKSLGEGLKTLATDLGPEWRHTVVVVMSEFGRTARQNGTNGTDHGHGNAMWVMGGPVAGGKVYGDWPGLDDAQLHEGRDLAVTTDFRSVLKEICERHLQVDSEKLAGVFPNAPNTPASISNKLISV